MLLKVTSIIHSFNLIVKCAQVFLLVHGTSMAFLIRSLVIRQKMKILLIIKSCDFVFLTETWSSVSVNISGFKAISSNVAPPKSKHKSRLSGGITLLFNNIFQKYVSVVNKSHFSLWCMISKELLNSENHLYLCGVYIYIPPEQSNYYDIEIFDNLENEAIMFPTKGNVMLIGDFNARTSKLEDFVSTEGNKHVYQFNQDKFNKKKQEKTLIPQLITMEKD